MTRYEWEPLERLIVLHLGDKTGVKPSVDAVAVAVGTDRRQVYRWRKIGVDRNQADRLAFRLDLHPYEVWPEMRGHDEAEATAAEIECGAEDCTVRFIPSSHPQRYCTPRCRDRQKARRWRRSDKGRAAIRRQRSTPSVKERNRAARRAYYAENADYERARQRRYDRERRAAARGEAA